jgi:hypothetical protein
LSFLKNPYKKQRRSGLGCVSDDDAKEQQTNKTTYKKRKRKNQTKTTRKQGEHRDEEGRPFSLIKPHKAARRAPLRR